MVPATMKSHGMLRNGKNTTYIIVFPLYVMEGSWKIVDLLSRNFMGTLCTLVLHILFLIIHDQL